MQNDPLLQFCLTNQHNRHWWFRVNRHLPSGYAVLDDESRRQLIEFFKRSEASGLRIGDCNVPCISLLSALVLSNNITRIVSLGHSLGYSVILLAMYAKIRGSLGAIYSVDIDREHTAFAQQMISDFKLGDYATLVVGDSIDPDNISKAFDYFSSKEIDLMFIDSKHEYKHALSELRLWYPHVKSGGFIVLHDVSDKAIGCDSGRGVQNAVIDFCNEANASNYLLINKHVTAQHTKAELVYLDGCGFGLIQKH